LSLPSDLGASNSPGALHPEFEELTNAPSELTALIEEFKKLTGVLERRGGDRSQSVKSASLPVKLFARSG
jgi:hypothetical protein